MNTVEQQAQKAQEELKARVLARFSQAEIDGLEKKHGKLTVIEVEDKMGLFRRPDRKTMSAASVMATTDPMEYVATIADNCLVAGDRELIDDDAYFYSVMPLINELIETKTASLLKL
jgi:hypothetical protein